MSGACWMHVGCMLDACWMHVGCMFDACWIRVGCMLQTCYKHVANVLQSCCNHVASMMQPCWKPCCKHVANMLQTLYKNVANARCTRVASMLQTRRKHLQALDKYATNTLQTRCKHVANSLETFWLLPTTMANHANQHVSHGFTVTEPVCEILQKLYNQCSLKSVLDRREGRARIIDSKIVFPKYSSICVKTSAWLGRCRFANDLFWHACVVRLPVGQWTMFHKTMFWIFELYSWASLWACIYQTRIG